MSERGIMSKNEDLESIVVLIDADNAHPAKLKAIIDEISTYGRIVVKKAYGNWKDTKLKNWEPELKRLAIKPEQQFAYTTGKNATDISLTIDAMDLLYTKLYDAFVLVSSDSDYTPLAIRLRESGVAVLGVGETKTPDAFRNACDDFILTENLNGSEPVKDESAGAKQKAKSPSAKAVSENSLDYIHNLLKTANEKYQDADGWVNISAAGQYIKRVKPDFTAKTFGYSKLPDLVQAYPKKYEYKTYMWKGTKIHAYKLK